MRKNFFIFLIFGILFFNFVSATYVSSTRSSSFSSDIYSSFGEITSSGFLNSECVSGQDFIIQISPTGCTPTVVRSDLLEEQDVTVFCELQAIKINPFINIESIKDIDFSSSSMSSQVKSIGFVPSYSALEGKRKLNSLQWDSIGYVSITLNQQANESALLNCEDSIGGEVCWVKGDLSARVEYDLEGGFGLRTHTFYLPVLTDEEFEKRAGQYSFFDHRGYLRAEDVSKDSATFSVYSGLLQEPYKAGSNSKLAYSSYTLNIDDETPEFLLPGLDCLAGVQFKLDDIDVADTRAKLLINSEIIEVSEGEKFLGDKCTVASLETKGLNQIVKIRCKGDEKTETFELSLNPTVNLKISDNGLDKEVNVEVGQKVFNANDGSAVYLGYAGFDGDDNSNLELYLVSLPAEAGKEKLTDSEISAASFIAQSYKTKKENIADYFVFVSGGVNNFFRNLVWGESFVQLSKLETKTIGGKTVSFTGFGVQKNAVMDKITSENYTKALIDYDKILNSHDGVKYPESDVVSLSERALFEKIYLANNLNQKEDLIEFCDEFTSKYPDSYLDVSICDDLVLLSNDGVSNRDILIEGDYKRISFERIYEPSYDEYGAELWIGLPGGKQMMVQLRKNDIIYLGENSYDSIKLVEVGEDSAKIAISIQKTSTRTNVLTALTSNEFTLVKDSPNNLGTPYTFILKDTNLEKVAKVIVEPSINYDGSTVDFSYKIGIEKRAIQLSPEMTKSLINKLNDSIGAWNKIADGLDASVKVLSNACLVTGGVLTLKNLVFGFDGKSIARQQVMKGNGGWYEICSDKVDRGEYNSLDACYIDNAGTIDAQVNQVLSAMNSQNDKIKSMQSSLITKTGLLGDKVVDTDKLVETYSSEIKENFGLGAMENPSKKGEFVNLGYVASLLEDKYYEEGVYDLEDLKKVDLYMELVNSYPEDEFYKKNLYAALKDIEVNGENSARFIDLQAQSVKDGMSTTFRSTTSTKKTISENVYDGAISVKKGEIPSGLPIQGITTGTQEYYVTLKSLEGNKYRILDIYFTNGTKVVENTRDYERVKDLFEIFVKYDEDSYNNQYKNAKVQYYETEPYKGLPAIVPIDVKKGWYAYMEHTLPTYGALKTYDDSGVVRYFYLCNVGPNGLQEFTTQTRDDVCQLVNTDTSNANSFPGLTKEKTLGLIKEATNAISQAKTVQADVKAVSILGQKIEVGAPAMDSSSVECTDYMSPKECQLMFNLCDPVICPESRCDFGGSYPVDNVVQSGIIGSLTLCLPNWNDGIYMPVCLTGLKAGVDNFVTVLSSYRDCLQTSLDTGETVGVCDQIHSIYLCEFFWKQALPLAKVGIPKLLSYIAGENTRGGGEYLGVQSAWKNMQDSVSYFTQYYAVNAYNAFKARSQEEVGTEVCKTFISTSYPNGYDLLDTITEAQSPVQFNAKFEEIEYESITNPPVSQYKVYYHIYAGNDRGAYFQVYLRGKSGSSYYYSTGSKMVDSGYVSKGDYVSETVDFTFTSGLTELCVRVNEQEDCGFGSVTTSFASDYVKDEYIESQATETQITTEEDCVSGTASVYDLLNLNAQAGIENALNPEIYNDGLIRICSTDNPGIGTDPYLGTEDQRWIEVGYCGNKNTRCWIDKDSVGDAVNFEVTEEDALKDLTQTYIDTLIAANGYMSQEEFEAFILTVENEENVFTKITLLSQALNKIYMNTHKGYVYYLRGNVYRDLANGAYRNYLAGIKPETTEEENVLVATNTIENIVSSEDYISPYYALRLAGLGNDVFFIYIKGDWYLSKGVTSVTGKALREGDSKVFLSKLTVEDGLHNVNKVNVGNYEDVEANLMKLLRDKDYPEGLKVLMDYTSSKKAGTTHDLESGNVTMNYKKIFEVAVPEVDQIYFYYHTYPSGQSTWTWSFEELALTSDDWLTLDKFETDGIKYSTNIFKKILGSVTPASSASLSMDISVIPSEYEALFKSLKEQDEIEGAMILFEDEVVWNKLTTSPTTIKYEKDEVLNKVNELQKAYESFDFILSAQEYDEFDNLGILANRENYVETTETLYLTIKDVEEYVEVLISAGIIKGNVRSYVIKNYVSDRVDVDFENIIASVDSSGYFSDYGVSSTSQETSNEIIDLDSASERVLATCQNIEGDDATFNGTRGITSSCWTAVTYVYENAGVKTSCVYSDSKGREYTVSGKTIGIGTTLSAKNSVVFQMATSPTKSCSLNKENGENLDETTKLNNLQSGDIISYVWNSQSGHNAIFIDWADKSKWNATLFDWNGVGGTFRYYTAVISDEGNHPVYMYWKPVISTSSTSSTVTGTKYSLSSSCTSSSGCQLLLGKEVQNIVKNKKTSVVSDTDIQNDLNVKSFECLVLMVAMQESSLQFCSTSNKNGNPLYCEGDKSQVLSPSSDYGVMQLNSNYFSDVDLTYFKSNVESAVDKLITDYSAGKKSYPNGRYYECTKETYSGWEYAIRLYNGWNECGKGDVDYVENVLSRKSDVQKLFPECAI